MTGGFVPPLEYFCEENKRKPHTQNGVPCLSETPHCVCVCTFASVFVCLLVCTAQLGLKGNEKDNRNSCWVRLFLAHRNTAMFRRHLNDQRCSHQLNPSCGNCRGPLTRLLNRLGWENQSRGFGALGRLPGLWAPKPGGEGEQNVRVACGVAPPFEGLDRGAV